MRQSEFTPEFVTTVPEELEEGRLYISERFRTASHLCACGCGAHVVTSLKPAKWQLTNRDGRVSLSPSIGRWQLPCQSHYWIRDNRVVWSYSFTEEEKSAVQRRDAQAVRDYYEARRGRRSLEFLRRVWRRLTGRDRPR
ncbi:DUF6527 family protein [Leifsonia sp. McL0607]|uniref:DUF6527 family protein n=1 Tax=Leifsonia sp. McL0607 TaxID=3415672 RepID=UPI003CEB32F7